MISIVEYTIDGRKRQTYKFDVYAGAKDRQQLTNKKKEKQQRYIDNLKNYVQLINTEKLPSEPVGKNISEGKLPGTDDITNTHVKYAIKKLKALWNNENSKSKEDSDIADVANAKREAIKGLSSVERGRESLRKKGLEDTSSSHSIGSSLDANMLAHRNAVFMLPTKRNSIT